MSTLTERMFTLQTADDGWGKDDFHSERDGSRSLRSDSLASDLPTDAALLASLDKPQRPLPASRCPFPMH